MAWTDLSTGEDWTPVSVVNEYITSLRERQRLLGDTQTTLVVAGDDIQDHDFWAAIQNFFINGYYKFVDPNTAIVGSATTDVDDFLYVDAAALYTEAGLGSGFRRKQNMGDAWSYGPMVAGDIIGEWIFEDLQKAFGATNSVPVAYGTAATVDWVLDGSADNRKEGGSATDESSWPDAKSAADTAFASGASHDSTRHPAAYTQGVYSTPPEEWEAYVFTAMNNGKVVLPAGAGSKVLKIEFYVLAEPFGDFDDYGSGVTNGTWYRFNTTNSPSTDTVYSDTVLGSITQPSPWCDDPKTGNDRGWDIDTIANGVRPYAVVTGNWTYG